MPPSHPRIAATVTGMSEGRPPNPSELSQLEARYAALHGFVHESAPPARRAGGHSSLRLVLFRHSIRGPIPLDRYARDVPLLPAGAALAQDFGGRWRRPVSAVLSSPLQRCTHTARHFLDGAGLEIATRTTRALGAPGAFVRDEDGAWDDYVRHRKHQLVREARLRPEALRGYGTPAWGVRALVEQLESHWSSSSSAHGDESASVLLGFSHDLLMSLLLTWAFDREWTDEDWPEFHEGLVAWREGGELCVWYRGSQVRRALPAQE